MPSPEDAHAYMRTQGRELAEAVKRKECNPEVVETLLEEHADSVCDYPFIGGYMRRLLQSGLDAYREFSGSTLTDMKLT